MNKQINAINIHGWKLKPLPKFIRLIRHIISKYDNWPEKLKALVPPKNLIYRRMWPEYRHVERDNEVGSSWLIDFVYSYNTYSELTWFGKGDYNPPCGKDKWPLFWGRKELFSYLYKFPTPRYGVIKFLDLLQDYELKPNFMVMSSQNLPKFIMDKKNLITINKRKNRIVVLIWNYQNYNDYIYYTNLLYFANFGYTVCDMNNLFKNFIFRRRARISNIENNAWRYLMNYLDWLMRRFPKNESKMKYLIEKMDKNYIMKAHDYVNIHWETPQDIIYVEPYSVHLLEYERSKR